MSMQEVAHVIETFRLLLTPCPALKPDMQFVDYPRHKKIRDDFLTFLDFMAEKVLNPKMPSDTGEFGSCRL